jgi:hypothetical protein
MKIESLLQLLETNKSMDSDICFIIKISDGIYKKFTTIKDFCIDDDETSKTIILELDK